MRRVISSIQNLARKLVPLEKFVIPHEELGGLLFGQQTAATQGFFTRHFGQYHTIPLANFPHTQFFESHLEDPFSDHLYAQYLAASWTYYYEDTNTQARRLEFIKKKIDQFRFIESRKRLGPDAIGPPIVLADGPDCRTIIVDGNHRAAIAYAMGIDAVAVFIPYREHLRRIISIPQEFYGTKKLRMPYQSISHRGQLLLQGRRQDLQERIQLMDPHDLKGKSVLDLGCNIGMNCYLAVEAGAREAVGIDRSKRLVTAAARINCYFAAPCRFLVQDLDKEPSELGRFDTVFCLSVAAHVKDPGMLVTWCQAAAKETVYFEGHAKTKRDDYVYLLNSDNFSAIDLIGHTHDGRQFGTKTRPLFRCKMRA